MKKSKQRLTLFAAIISVIVFFTSFGAAGESDVVISSKEEDAFILYKYSLIDAKRNHSPKITESSEGDKTIYNYDGHALSCRTVMNGSISNTTLENRTHVVGDFEVSNNTYGITRLSFDFYDEGSKTRTGTMTVNGKVIGIEHFDNR